MSVEFSVIEHPCFTCQVRTRFTWDPDRRCWRCELCGGEEPEGDEREEASS